MKRRIGQKRYPPGHQPYDSLNGLRVGAIAGGIIAMVPVALDAPGGAWLVVVGALFGGGAGYVWERRATRGEGTDQRPPV